MVSDDRHDEAFTRLALPEHVLRAHVGLTPAELSGTLVEEGLTRASSFADAETAEWAVNEVVLRRAVDIQTWLAEPTAPLHLDEAFDAPTGISLRKNSTAVTTTYGVRVILDREPTPRGYRLVTAHPI